MGTLQSSVPAPYGLSHPSVPHHLSTLEPPRPGQRPPGRSGERTREPLQAYGAAQATLDSFIERKPPFARVSICFPAKQVTAGNASSASALYLGPVNASHPRSPDRASHISPGYTPRSPFFPQHTHSATRLLSPHFPRPGHTPLSPPPAVSPLLPPSRLRSRCCFNGRDRPTSAACSEQGPGGRQIWGIARGQ